MSSAIRRIPYGADAAVRKRQDLERAQKEQAAARSIDATEIGTGGVLKVKGSISVEPGGDITLEAGDFDAANVAASVDMDAGQDVNATRDVTAGRNMSAAGSMTATGRITSTGDTFWSLYALNNQVSTGYFALYVNSDGRFGRTVSARRYKQDISNFSPSTQAVFAMQLRQYRLKQAVDELGPDAPFEYGMIAEELVDCGLGWLVLRGADGQVEGIAYEKVALALIPVVQDHERRLLALEGA